MIQFLLNKTPKVHEVYFSSDKQYRTEPPFSHPDKSLLCFQRLQAPKQTHSEQNQSAFMMYPQNRPFSGQKSYHTLVVPSLFKDSSLSENGRSVKYSLTAIPAALGPVWLLVASKHRSEKP